MAVLGSSMLPAVPCLIGITASRTTVTATMVSVLCVPVLNKFKKALWAKKQLKEPPVPLKAAHKGGGINCFLSTATFGAVV